MIYLDYSATTPVNNDVLDTFNRVSKDFMGNPNSLHSLGSKSANLISSATKQIADILGVKESEIIYTSGASESNNTAIKGICLKYPHKKHIITTYYEHSSINSPLKYLETLNYEIEYLKDNEGIIVLDDLKAKLRKDTCLVIVSAVNSEIGLLQPINEIGKIVKDNSNAVFFSDITQLVGKKRVDLKYIDLASFSAHKFFGIKGIGGLVKKANIELIPLIMGGKSTTVYRSGTQSPALIASMAKALRLANNNLDKYDYILSLNKYLKSNIVFNDHIAINSNDNCLPHILNISVLGIKPESLLHALEKYDIYISTKTACSSDDGLSLSVLNLTKNKALAASSIRISLSYLTTKEELNEFLIHFKECVNKLLDIKKQV